MENPLSSIQISKDFKEVLRREKGKDESFEAHIKQLRNKGSSIDNKKSSIDNKKSSIDKETSKYKGYVEVEDGIHVEKKLVKQYKEANKIKNV